MTPRQMIAKWIEGNELFSIPVAAQPDNFLAALSAAGFVIVPREYPLKLADAAPPLYESSGDGADIQRLWETLIAAWEKMEKTT